MEKIDIIREDIKTSKPIRFDGNGYCEEWKEEAAKRGLDCEPSCPVCFDRYLDSESVKMFEDMNVMKDHELKARNEYQKVSIISWVNLRKKIS